MTIAPEPNAGVDPLTPGPEVRSANRVSFPVRRPYLFALLLILIQLAVGTVASVFLGPIDDSLQFNFFIFWTATSVMLALIAALLLSRLGWWGRVGFRVSRRPRRDLLLCLPLCLILAWNLSQIDAGAIVPPLRIVGLVLLTALAAFVEETFYRGLMLRALEARGIWQAAVVSASIFGLMHLPSAFAGSNLGMTVGQIAYATAIGFAYAAYALRTGLIWPLILVHALANLADLIDQETIFSTSTPTETDLFRWAIYVVVFAAYGILTLRSIAEERRTGPVSHA